MAEGIRAMFNDQDVFIEINNSRILVRREHLSTPEERVESKDGSSETVVKDIPLTEVRSLHVKSGDGHFLKLKLPEESVVFSFDSHHSRDVTKSILLSFMKSEQEILKRILESDPTMKAMFNNLKQHISPSKFWAVNKDKIRQMSSVVRQQPSKEIDMEDKDFISMLNPTLLKIFGQMNCSLSQFYNLLSQSYFSNIKNQKNSLDRMISSVVREYEVKQDFATRINNYSILALKPIESAEIQASAKAGRKVEFLPVYPFEEKKVERARRAFKFEKRDLSCNIELEIEPMMDKVMFDKKDLIWIRDLSKVVYKAVKENDTGFFEEVRDATKVFLESMRKKYGDEKIIYLTRILPTYFIKGE